MKQPLPDEDDTEKSDDNFQNYSTRIHKQVKTLLEELKNSPRWNLSSRKYQKEQLENIFCTLRKPQELKYLWLHWNNIENICKMVIQPAYSQLKIMNLGGNGIVSVELLIHAKMNTLEELWMWNNNLTRVDCLRKLHAPSLRYIDLSSNHIVEWNRFGELQTNCLEYVNVQSNRLASIDNFIKNIDPKSNCLLTFAKNDLITVFGKMAHKKKQVGKYYDFSKKRISFV